MDIADPHIMTDQDKHILIFPDLRPSRADAVKNRELLLQTASRLFQENGVEAVSMTQLAQEAGVGKGTLYRHFTNKAELTHALLDQDMRELQDKTLERLRQPADPVETLRWFLAEVAQFVDRNNELLAVTVQSERITALAFPAHIWWRQTIRGLLAKTHPPGDLDYISDVLYVMLDVNTIHFQRHNLGYSLERITQGLFAVVDRLVGCR